jgi:hypothetical protein
MNSLNDAGVTLVFANWHYHALAYLNVLAKDLRNAIGEYSRQGQGQYHICKKSLAFHGCKLKPAMARETKE